MHDAAYTAMEQLLKRSPSNTNCVLDVGSLDVNGTYRPMIEKRGWNYTGIDIRKGSNVDEVVHPYCYPFGAGEFDVVISGSTMEHVEHPWLWLPEIARVLRPGGLLAIVTHWSFPLHEYPVDTFRYMPHGMKALFDWTGMLHQYDIRIINDTDIVGSALKR